MNGIQEVSGSIPLSSIVFFLIISLHQNGLLAREVRSGLCFATGLLLLRFCCCAFASRYTLPMPQNLPGQFKIQAPFPPKGDQPQAIQKLVQGARDGLAHQVLLGATGTGKSVAWDEPVTVRQPNGAIFRGPIGELLDTQLGQHQPLETLETAAPAN